MFSRIICALGSKNEVPGILLAGPSVASSLVDVVVDFER
jgi:hypothetical protein